MDPQNQLYLWYSPLLSMQAAGPTLLNPNQYYYSPFFPSFQSLKPVNVNEFFAADPPESHQPSAQSQKLPSQRSPPAKIEGSKDKQQIQNLCNCSRTHCLKEYCLCFKNGAVCGQKCKCTDCKNVVPRTNEKLGKKKRNPNACTCKKSQCAKKYCECFVAGRKCGEDCVCLDCCN